MTYCVFDTETHWNSENRVSNDWAAHWAAPRTAAPPPHPLPSIITRYLDTEETDDDGCYLILGKVTGSVFISHCTELGTMFTERKKNTFQIQKLRHRQFPWSLLLACPPQCQDSVCLRVGGITQCGTKAKPHAFTHPKYVQHKVM